MTDTRIKWDDSFLIGIEELDYEHEKLLDSYSEYMMQILIDSVAGHVYSYIIIFRIKQGLQ